MRGLSGAYHQFVKGANLSRPIRSWDGQTPPDPEVVEFVKRAGSDIAPHAGSGGVLEQKGEFRLPAEDTVRVWDSSGSPRTIRALEFSVLASQALAFSKARREFSRSCTVYTHIQKYSG